MKKNEHGFSAVEVIIVIIFIGLIGSAGYYVWKHNQNKPVEASNTNTQKEAATSSGTFSDDTITFTYPKDWQMVDTLKHPGNYAVDPTWLGFTSFFAQGKNPDMDSPEMRVRVTKDAPPYEESLASAKAESRYSDVTPMEVGGIKGYTYTVNYEGTQDTAAFFVDGKLYTFTGGYDNKTEFLGVLKTIKRVE